ncbi:MAG: SBBP repeat-containing protein [Candidatus Thorarchaeota archaeon]
MKNERLALTLIMLTILLLGGVVVGATSILNTIEADRQASIAAEDWELYFSTLLGGNHTEVPYDIEMDNLGYIYVAVAAYGVDCPTTGNLTEPSTEYNVVLAKFQPDGTPIYIQLLAHGNPRAIALDSNNDVYVAGSSNDPDFPTTEGAFQTEMGDAASCGFVIHLSGDDASILDATLLGSAGGSAVLDMYLDSSNDVYVTGQTNDPQFPTSDNAYMSTTNGSLDGFVSHLDGDLSEVMGGTLFGGLYRDQGRSLCLDNSGNVYVAGTNVHGSLYSDTDEAYIAKFSPDFSQLLWDDWFGTPGDQTDTFYDIAYDPAGSVVAVGLIESDGHAVDAVFNESLHGASDALVAEYTLSGTPITISYLGGTGDEWFRDVDIVDGYRYFCGYSSSEGFPILDLYEESPGGEEDIIIMKTDSEFNIIYSLGFGGQSTDQGYSMDVIQGIIAVAGVTRESGFPLKNAYQDEYGGAGYYDACILMLTEPDADTIITYTTASTTATGTTTGPSGGEGIIALVLENLPLLITIVSVLVIVVVGGLRLRKR